LNYVFLSCVYLIAFIYLHGIHRLGFLLEEVFSVRYELNICHFSLQGINMWIHKGHDKDGPQRTDPDRHGRIRFTSEAVPRDNKDSAFPQTVGRSVLCEVRTEYLCHFSLQRINMWIRKGNDKDGPRRIDADRHERIRFTSDDKDSAFPQTVGRSVLCEVRTEYLCHFSLQRINMWIRKGNDKDGPRRMDPDRHGRIRFTSEVMPRDNKDSAFPQTDHDWS